MKKETLNGIIAGGVILAVALGAYMVFKKKKDGTPTPPNGGGGGYDNGSGSGGAGGLNFDSIADILFEAMDGYGTANTTIENELKKLKTKSDWDKLVYTFGNRTISSGRGNIFQSDFTGTLPECLNDELDSSELESANKILNKIGVSI